MQKKKRVSLFCARLFVTLPSEMAKLHAFGKKNKWTYFVLRSFLCNFAIKIVGE